MKTSMPWELPERATIAVVVEDVSIAVRWLAPPTVTGSPLIVALHGGGYDGGYFDVATTGHGSFLETAAGEGFPVASVDRTGYGASTPSPPADPGFECQARRLADAIPSILAQVGGDGVVLVGHSIGGMLALCIAGGAIDFPLLGVCASGMGAVPGADGAAAGLAAAAGAAGLDVLPLPPEQADAVLLGPDWTFDTEVQDAAHRSYQPAVTAELVEAPAWTARDLPGVAARIQVPVHHALAEFDALWDSSPAGLATFAGLFTAAPFVQTGLARGTGHSIDHHRLGHALHLRQLAFAAECALVARGA